jgi:cell division protein FtsN
MTDYDRDRGAYTPSGEAPLAFDPRGQGPRGAGRPPTTLIISALILLVLLGGVFIYYRSGVRHSGEPPVVGQPLGDIKQAAPASSQPADEAAGLSIYKAEDTPASAIPTFTAPPEQPRPLPAPPKVQAQAIQPALKGPVAPSAPTRQASAPAATAEDAAGAPEASLEAPVARPAKAAAQPKPAVEAASAAGGAHMVQIGAYSSKPLAEKGWNDVAKLMPGDMAGHTESFEPVSKDGQTLYRAFIGGFGSRADAQAFCEQLKGQGHTCLVK